MLVALLGWPMLLALLFLVGSFAYLGWVGSRRVWPRSAAAGRWLIAAAFAQLLALATPPATYWLVGFAQALVQATYRDFAQAVVAGTAWIQAGEGAGVAFQALAIVMVGNALRRLVAETPAARRSSDRAASLTTE